MMTSQESGNNDNNIQEEPFKKQLDKAADETREMENQKPNPIVEKSKPFSKNILATDQE